MYSGEDFHLDHIVDASGITKVRLDKSALAHPCYGVEDIASLAPWCHFDQHTERERQFQTEMPACVSYGHGLDTRE